MLYFISKVNCNLYKIKYTVSFTKKSTIIKDTDQQCPGEF